MWKKGELVWANLKYPDLWLPGRVQDPSEPFGVLVAFFGLKEPRYFPAPLLRRFERDFGTVISGSRRLCRRIVNRALRAHFWSISYGLWCPCQPPITSPYLDRENSLPWFPTNSYLALGFIRDIAISRPVPLEGLADANCWTAQILSFRRYTVDFVRSKALYEEIRASKYETSSTQLLSRGAELMGDAEEPELCVDRSHVDPMFPEKAGSDMGNDKDLSLRDPSSKDILGCCPSPAEQLREDDEVQICSWNLRKPQANSETNIILKACKTQGRLAKREDDHPSKRNRLLKHEAVLEEIIDEITTTFFKHKNVISSEPLPHSPNAMNGKACLVKLAPSVVPEACETLTYSVNEKDAYWGSKPGSCMISTETSNEETADRNTVSGSRENRSVDALDPLIAEVGQVPAHMTGTPSQDFRSHDVGAAPAEQLPRLDAVTTHENQKRNGDNVKSVKMKRKASVNASSADSFKKQKSVAQQSTSVEKPLNPCTLKAKRIADPRCLRMKFLGNHDHLPSKANLVKTFSVFGEIDTSSTYVDTCKRSAKIVFLRSIDAVVAYDNARSEKNSYGQSKVVYGLDLQDLSTERNKGNAAQEEPQEAVPTLKPCLKKPGSARRNLKVKFQMEDNE